MPSLIPEIALWTDPQALTPILSLSLSDFFREAAGFLCGALRPERALPDFLNWLRQAAPVEGVALLHLDEATRSLHIDVACEAPGGPRMPGILHISRMAWAPGGPLHIWTAPEKCPGRAAERAMPALDEYLTDYFRRLLDACGGRIAGLGGAAEMAGLHPNTLRSRLDKLGISYHTRNPGRD